MFNHIDICLGSYLHSLLQPGIPEPYKSIIIILTFIACYVLGCVASYHHGKAAGRYPFTLPDKTGEQRNVALVRHLRHCIDELEGKKRDDILQWLLTEIAGTRGIHIDIVELVTDDKRKKEYRNLKEILNTWKIREESQQVEKEVQMSFGVSLIEEKRELDFENSCAYP